MVTTLFAKIAMLFKQLQTTQLQGSQAWENLVQASPLSCDKCHGPHSTMECQMVNPIGELTIE